MVRVKICGITSYADALHAIDCGAEELGFNFYEGSPRFIEPYDARLIVQRLPKDISKVGVVVNMSELRVRDLVDLVGLTAIQLHGDEDKPYIDVLTANTGAQIIKAFRVNQGFDRGAFGKYKIDRALLDAYSEDQYGGTGTNFDWLTAEAVKGLARYIYLAGGLNPENVADAIRIVRPYAVDVASGVESSPGKKDPKKVREFIENAKNA